MNTAPQQLNHPDKAPPLSWESYLQQLGAQFQPNITQPDAILRLSALTTQNQLAIGVHKGYVVVSYGEPSEQGMLPNAEVVFDIGENGDLAASEILYTPEVWGDFQKTLADSNLLASDEQGFDGERFATYLLGKVTQEAWTKAGQSL